MFLFLLLYYYFTNNISQVTMKIKYLVVQKTMTSFKSFTSHLKASPPEFIPERFSRWDLFTSRFSRFFLAHLLLLLFLVVVGGIVVRFASFCIFQTANAHFFFFPASVELSKRFESNGSSLKFFFTMVAQTNNENARSLARDLSFCALSSRVVSVQNAVRASSRSF